MPFRRKHGEESMEVDWASSTLAIMYQLMEKYFIATLPYSQFSYIEAFLDIKYSNWLIAHIHAF